MDNKLIRFFNKIGFKDIDNFNDSKVEKVTINTNDDTWNVYIKNLKPININSVINLINVAKNGIAEVSEINIIFKNEIIDNDNVIEYFKYLLNDLVKVSPSLSSIVNNEIVLDNNIITIEVISDLEERMIKKECKNLINKLNKLGIPINNINTKINEELKKMVKKEIKEARVEVVKNEEPTNKVIMGESIKGRISTIDSIISEENNIVVEAYVFGTDIFESSKSNFKILTLKISDKSDSIMAKIFSKDEEEFKSICKSIKTGNWYKIRGYIKNDPYANDMVFQVKILV